MSLIGAATSASIGWLKHAAAAGSTLLNGLVSYWALDEVSGTRADSVGANDLTDNNTVGVSLAGPSGTVASFVGANTETLSSADLPAFGDADFTIVTWYYATTTNADVLIGRDASDGREFTLDIESALRFYVGGSNVVSIALPSANAFHFVVAYHNSTTSKVGLSLDGGTSVEADAATPAAPVSAVFRLGARDYGGAEGYFDGRMARTGVWSRLLSAEEITSLFNSGVGKSYADLTTAEKVGLVSYWNLDEVSGTRADAHGENDLTDNNTVGSVNSGPAGTVATFVEANSESLSKSGTIMPENQTRSVAFWFRTADVTQTSALASSGNTPTSGEPNWFLELASSKLKLYSSTGDPGSFGYNAGTATLLNNQWYYVVYVYDHAGKTHKVYLNGVEDVTTTVPTTEGTAQEDGVFYLGVGFNGYFSGNIARVGYWSSALDASTRSSLFNSGVGKEYADLTAGEKTNLVSYWNLDESSGTRADSHGANDLTDNNTVGSVVNAGGAMHNAAASFVAANSESLTAGDEAVGKLGEFTVSCWYKPASVEGAGGVIGRSGWSTLSDIGWGIRRSTTSLQMVLGSGAAYDLKSSAVTLEVGQWYHILLWYDSADSKLRISVNGETPVATDALVVNQLEGIIFTLAGYSYCPADGGPSTFETGLIDETGLWSRVLTEDERTELFNAGRGKFYDFSS